MKQYASEDVTFPLAASNSSLPTVRFLPADLPAPVVPGPGPTEGDEAPQWAWRGLLIDSARTFWTVETILEILELMARYRLNRLHWHLTDNSGWRFPVHGYRRLTDVAARIPRPDYAEYTNVEPEMLRQYHRSAPHLNNSGFYDAEDIARVVDRATALGIQVVPELDLPGHMEAVLRAYPDLGNPELRGVPRDQWPSHEGLAWRNNLLWPSEEAFTFVRAALEALCDLFPGNVVHVGGDECDHVYWEHSPVARQWMGEHGVPDGRALQGVFMDLARQVLSERGRVAGVWDEAVDSGLGDQDVVFGWRDHVGTQTAQASGHPWVFCDAAMLYLNRVERGDGSDPIGMRGPVTLEQVAAVSPPDSERCLGLQASVWCEFVTSREQLHYQLLPRLLAVATRGWWGETLTREEVLKRVRLESQTLITHGYAHAFHP